MPYKRKGVFEPWFEDTFFLLFRILPALPPAQAQHCGAKISRIVRAICDGDSFCLSGERGHNRAYAQLCPEGQKTEENGIFVFAMFFCNIDKYMKIINNIIVQFDDIEGLTLR